MLIFRHLIAVLMACAALVVNTASASFSDIDPRSSYYDSVNYVQKEQIVDGYEDRTFKPGNQINRAEFVKMLVASLYTPEEIADCVPSFVLADLTSKDWYYPYVCVAINEGILNGYPDGTFGAQRFVNFAELSKMIVAAYDLPMMIEGPVWYQGYVHALQKANAWPPAASEVAKYTTRGEFAEVLYRLRGMRPGWAKVLLSAELPAGDFTEENGNYFGTVYVKGFAWIKERKEMYCENDCNSYSYVMLSLTEQNNPDFQKFLSSRQGNAYVDVNAIGLGCVAESRISYENVSDSLDNINTVLSSTLSDAILSATKEKPITLKLTKEKLTSGSAGSNCYSHITHVEAVE